MSWLQRLLTRRSQPSQWFPADFVRPNPYDRNQILSHWTTGGGH